MSCVNCDKSISGPKKYLLKCDSCKRYMHHTCPGAKMSTEELRHRLRVVSLKYWVCLSCVKKGVEDPTPEHLKLPPDLKSDVKGKGVAQTMEIIDITDSPPSPARPLPVTAEGFSRKKSPQIFVLDDSDDEIQEVVLPRHEATFLQSKPLTRTTTPGLSVHFFDLTITGRVQSGQTQSSKKIAHVPCIPQDASKLSSIADQLREKPSVPLGPFSDTIPRVKQEEGEPISLSRQDPRKAQVNDAWPVWMNRRDYLTPKNPWSAAIEERSARVRENHEGGTMVHVKAKARRLKKNTTSRLITIGC